MPCFNEAAVVAAFWSRLKAALDALDGIDARVLFVDDGSEDDTLAVIERIAAVDARVDVASFTRNFGHQAALTAGLDLVRADAVVTMDSDLQHPPELLASFVAGWREGHDVVLAVRRKSGGGLVKRATSALFYRAINALSDTRIVPGAADFMLLSARAHDQLRRMPERHRFLRGMVAWLGFSRKLVDFDAAPRVGGASGYTFRKMWTLATDALASFSTSPIKATIRGGFLVLAAGLAYLAYTLARYAFWGDTVPGWASVVGVVISLGGAQIVVLGVVGSYVARIFEESKGRPLYVLKRAPKDVP